MKLYHGSNTAFKDVDLSLCRPNKDFGRGFYLTPDRIGAEKMARRTVKRYGGRPYVITFELDETAIAELPVKSFLSSNEEWALFVMANRRPSMEASDHNRDNRYAVVTGPIANDDLALLFRQFELGLATVEMLVREMRFKQLTIQYSFHTEQSARALRFVGVDDVY